ncbi:hypothetical protein GGR54DRAFT_607436, partial [Hypoxylon sp. NC1633]
MAQSSLLRFPLYGRETEFFIVEAIPNGSRPLDLKLVASESTAVYEVKLRHKRIGDYKEAGGTCSQEEWEEILISTLVHQRRVSGIEIKADVRPDGLLVILSFRKNVQGITTRLGSISLDEVENSDISPFDWCVLAITSREKMTEDLSAASAKIQDLEGDVQILKDEITELIKAKDEDQAQTLERVMVLLNSKKIKIKEQAKVLLSASAEHERLANIAGSRNLQTRKAQASRPSKRKVKEEPESDDEFEKMDADVDDDDSSVQSDIEEEHEKSTEDETASGTDTDDEPVHGNKAAAPNHDARASTSQKGTGPSSGSEKNVDAIPPRRALPFMKSEEPASLPAKPVDDDETES